jgi:predicted DNA-binding ribbon-helix-helix protein
MSSRAPGPKPTDRATVIARSVRVAGRPTSVRLELGTWEALEEVAARERKALADLVTAIDRTRTASTLSAAISVFLINYYRRATAAWRASLG